jgi:hypothetical protein
VAARSRSAKPAAADAALTAARAALGSALTDPTPRPLFGTATQPGFFSGSTAPVKAAARLCEERRWLEPTGEVVGKGKSARPLYRLTTEGAREAVARLDAGALAAFRSALEQVRRGLETLKALEAAVVPLQAAIAGAAAPAVPQSAPASPPPVPAATLRDVLRRKYDYLRRLVEFQGRSIDLPRLYEKAREDVPGLTVRQFHDELLKLWDERAVELHILNEVQSAARPDLGIRRGDALYYFILWRSPA